MNHTREKVVEILEALSKKNINGVVTATELGRLLKKHPYRIKVILMDLCSQGIVELIQKNKYQYWRLKK